MSESNKIKDTLEAAQGIVEAIPIYQDLAQPAVQEIGKGLHTISKLIHVALAPVSATVWGYEQILKYIQFSLEDKLKDVPPKNIISPDISIVGPAFEALRFVGEKDELRELFSTLISTSMNSETYKFAHPSYVEIIKQISPDEAKLLKNIDYSRPMPLIKVKLVDKDETKYYSEPLVNFSLLPFVSNCENTELGPSYINNLSRLGLINVSYTQFVTGENIYGPLANHEIVTSLKYTALKLNKEFKTVEGLLELTDFGKNFYNSCII